MQRAEELTYADVCSVPAQHVATVCLLVLFICVPIYNIRRHTSASVSIRQHTPVYLRPPTLNS
jgi:hypothetical protein